MVNFQCPSFDGKARFFQALADFLRLSRCGYRHNDRGRSVKQREEILLQYSQNVGLAYFLILLKEISVVILRDALERLVRERCPRLGERASAIVHYD